MQAVDQKEGKEESGEQAGEAVGQEETGKQAQNHSTTALDQSEEEEEEEGPASESDQPNPEVAEGHGTNESKQETQNDDVPPAVKFGPDDGLGPSLEELRSYDLSTRACGNYQNKVLILLFCNGSSSIVILVKCLSFHFCCWISEGGKVQRQSCGSHLRRQRAKRS